MKMLHLSIIVILLIITFFSTNYAFAQYGCPPIQGGWHPKIATNDNTVYVLWNYFYGCGQRLLLLRSSNDGGETFGNSVTVANADQAGSDPVVAASNNNVYVTWTEYSTNGIYYATWQSYTSLDQLHEGIFFKKSIDGGKTLENTTDLTGDIVISNPGYDIVADGNNLYIAGPDYAFKDSNHIMFSKSNDGGNSFSPQIDLDQNSMSIVPEFPFPLEGSEFGR